MTVSGSGKQPYSMELITGKALLEPLKKSQPLPKK